MLRNSLFKSLFSTSSDFQLPGYNACGKLDDRNRASHALQAAGNAFVQKPKSLEFVSIFGKSRWERFFLSSIVSSTYVSDIVQTRNEIYVNSETSTKDRVAVNSFHFKTLCYIFHIRHCPTSMYDRSYLLTRTKQLSILLILADCQSPLRQMSLSNFYTSILQLNNT